MAAQLRHTKYSAEIECCWLVWVCQGVQTRQSISTPVGCELSQATVNLLSTQL
jgi:hypothetical protein